MRSNFLYFVFVFSLLLSSCVDVKHSHDKLPPGIWRANLNLNESANINTLENKEKDIILGKNEEGLLPFNFEVIYINEKEFYIEIKNASERIKLDEIAYGRDIHTAKDTILIKFPLYDSYIKGIFSENTIEGFWVVNYKKNYRLPFLARYGQSHRFEQEKQAQKASLNLAGKWEVIFEEGKDDAYPAIGEFEQNGNKVTGTFLTETGDYRFLEGVVYGIEFKLSCFDGAHAFLFEGKETADGAIIGTFKSGKHYASTWSAIRNENFMLADADSLTYMKEDNEAIHFSFPNTNNRQVSLDDDQYKGKVKLIQILGTWCPNCMDETKFLLKYFKESPSKELAIIGVAFERYQDQNKAIAHLKKYKENLNIPYELLLGGFYDKKDAIKEFSMLNDIISYPTMIFIDKKGKVRKIHTGFSGPATSTYPEFVKNFDITVKSLLNE